MKLIILLFIVTVLLCYREYEGFQAMAKEKENMIANVTANVTANVKSKENVTANNNILDHSPDPTSPVELHNSQPYHLLDDEFSPHNPIESLSTLTRPECYIADNEQKMSKIGNFSQITNNYKRKYPDHCSAPFLELVSSFY
jgi:hypothetical protein